MKKLQRVFATLSLFLFFFAQGALAQSTPPSDVVGSDPAALPESSQDMMIAPEIIPAPQTNLNPLGQDHSYSVTLRGNGEAVVDFKAVFSNFSEQPMTELVFTQNDAGVSDVIAFQVIAERKCLEYAPIPLTTSFRNPNPTEPQCLSYGEPDYYSYWGMNNEFIRLEPVVDGSTIRVPLAREIQPDSAGSILLSYRSSEVVEPALFGAYEYEFNSLQINDKINNLQVGISTDADYILKGAESQVNYRTAPAIASMEDAGMSTGMKSQQLSTFYQEIGYGMLNKNASNLQPNETFTIEGGYAESTVQLYGKEIGIGLVIFAVLLTLIVIGIIVVVRKLNTGASSKETVATKGSTGLMNGPNILIIVLSSFVTSLVLMIVLGILMGLSQIMQYSFPWQYMQVMATLYLLLGGAVTMALMVIPPLVIGYKRGLWTGIATFIATILWLILYFVLVLVFMALFAPKDPYGYPVMMRDAMPMMDAGMGSGAKGGVMMEPAVEAMPMETVSESAPDTVERSQ